MKPLLILLRHLPTLEDEHGVYSDPLAEVALAPIDYKRLGLLGRSLEALRRNRIATELDVHFSPVERASRTVDHLFAITDCQVGRFTPDPRLTNIDHPAWNGLTPRDVEGTELYRRWHSRPSSVHFPDGESLQNVDDRVSSFLRSLRGDRDHLIVSHSTALQVLACRILGVDIDQIWSFYFEAYALTVAIRHTLVRFNWTGYDAIDADALHE